MHLLLQGLKPTIFKIIIALTPIYWGIGYNIALRPADTSIFYGIRRAIFSDIIGNWSVLYLIIIWYVILSMLHVLYIFFIKRPATKNNHHHNDQIRHQK